MSTYDRALDSAEQRTGRRFHPQEFVMHTSFRATGLTASSKKGSC